MCVVIGQGRGRDLRKRGGKGVVVGVPVTIDGRVNEMGISDMSDPGFLNRLILSQPYIWSYFLLHVSLMCVGMCARGRCLVR